MSSSLRGVANLPSPTQLNDLAQQMPKMSDDEKVAMMETELYPALQEAFDQLEDAQQAVDGIAGLEWFARLDKVSAVKTLETFSQLIDIFRDIRDEKEAKKQSHSDSSSSFSLVPNERGKGRRRTKRSNSSAGPSPPISRKQQRHRLNRMKNWEATGNPYNAGHREINTRNRQLGWYCDILIIDLREWRLVGWQT